jgi:hypothetical protein
LDQNNFDWLEKSGDYFDWLKKSGNDYMYAGGRLLSFKVVI